MGNVRLAEQEPANKKQNEEEKAATSAGYDFIPGKGADESKQSYAHGVHQEQEQNEGEESAAQQKSKFDRSRRRRSDATAGYIANTHELGCICKHGSRKMHTTSCKAVSLHDRFVQSIKDYTVNS